MVFSVTYHESLGAQECNVNGPCLLLNSLCMEYLQLKINFGTQIESRSVWLGSELTGILILRRLATILR